jgi:hypothetical protein
MISFTPADLDRFLSEDNGEPVVMLNLLRFRPDGGRREFGLRGQRRGTGSDKGTAANSLSGYHAPGLKKILACLQPNQMSDLWHQGLELTKQSTHTGHLLFRIPVHPDPVNDQ